MTAVARRQTMDPVALLAGNLVAWVPLAFVIALAPLPTDALQMVLIYLGIGVPVILVITVFVERPFLARIRERLTAPGQWAAIAFAGAGLALPGAVVFAVIGLVTDPAWTGIGAAVGAVVCGVAGVFVGIVGRALYPLMRRGRSIAWITVMASAVLLVAAILLLVGVFR